MLVTSRNGEPSTAGLGRIVLLLVLGLLPALLCAQWVDTTFYIPDSMTGLWFPTCLARNSLTHTLYVGGEVEDVVFALDDRTGQKLARILVGSSVCNLTCDETNNLVYCASADLGPWYVIDGAGNRVVRTIPTSDDPELAFVNPLTGRAYCVDWDRIQIVDGATGQVVRSLVYDDWVVYAFALDAVDRKLYIATEGELLVFDALSDSLELTLPAECDTASLAYNPANNRLYCAWNTQLGVIDCRTDSLVKTLTLPYDFYSCMLAVNGAGSRVYCLSDDGRLATIDCTRDTLARICNLVGDPTGVYYDTALDRLYCQDADGVPSICVLDGATGEPLSWIPVPGAFYGLVGNPSDNLLYCASDEYGVVYFIECGADSVVATLSFSGLPTGVCANSEMGRVYVGDAYGDGVVVIDDATRTIVSIVRTGGPVEEFAYDPANDKLYCAHTGGSVSVISTATNEVVADVRTGRGDGSLVYSPADNRVYCSNYWDNSVTVIDCDSDMVWATVPVSEKPRALCVNPVQNKIYCACIGYGGHSCVCVIDCHQNSEVAWIRVGAHPEALVFDPVGSKVYCASHERDSVYVISGVTDSVIARIPVGDHPVSLAYSADFNKVFCCNAWGNSVTVIDASSDQVITTIPVGRTPERVFYNPVSGLVYCANHGSDDVTVIQGANEQVLRTIPVQDGPRSIVANASGDRVYVANELRSSVSVLRDAGAVTPVSGLSGGTLFGHEMTLLGIRKAALYDLNGRKRGDLLPGSNDLSGFAPGIYFVRFSSGRVKTAKVIIAH
jgi:YVTN family beta-propeller protein